MSFSYQMRILLWCTHYRALSTTLRFGRTENLSLSSRKYARYVTFHDASTRSLIARTRGYNSCMHRSSVYPPLYLLTVVPNACFSEIGTVRGETSCLTRQICIPNRSTPSLWGEVEIFATRQRHIRGPGVQPDIFSSTLVCPVDMTLLTEHLSTTPCVVATGLRQNTRTTQLHATHFTPMCTT